MSVPSIKRVTYHSCNKYINEQAKKGIRVEKEFAEREILKLFSGARKEELNAGLLIRKMKNDFQPSEYYINGDWRFVVSNNTIVTVEVNTFLPYEGIGMQKPKRRKNRKWKH